VWVLQEGAAEVSSQETRVLRMRVALPFFFKARPALRE
jgi:hypothetical protein